MQKELLSNYRYQFVVSCDHIIIIFQRATGLYCVLPSIQLPSHSFLCAMAALEKAILIEWSSWSELWLNKIRCLRMSEKYSFASLLVEVPRPL